MSTIKDFAIVVGLWIAMVMLSFGPSFAQKKQQQLKAKTTAHSVALSWAQGTVATGSSPVSGNNVYRGTTAGGEGTTPLASLSSASVSYTDLAVVPGTTYFYQVTALNPCNGAPPVAPCESGRSNEISATIPPNNVAPNAPTGLTGVPQ